MRFRDAPARASQQTFALWSRVSNKEKTRKRKGKPDNKQKTKNNKQLCHSRMVATAFARGFPLLADLVASAIRSKHLKICQRNRGYRFDHNRHPQGNAGIVAPFYLQSFSFSRFGVQAFLFLFDG